MGRQLPRSRFKFNDAPTRSKALDYLSQLAKAGPVNLTPELVNRIRNGDITNANISTILDKRPLLPSRVASLVKLQKCLRLVPLNIDEKKTATDYVQILSDNGLATIDVSNSMAQIMMSVVKINESSLWILSDPTRVYYKGGGMYSCHGRYNLMPSMKNGYKWWRHENLNYTVYVATNWVLGYIGNRGEKILSVAPLSDTYPHIHKQILPPQFGWSDLSAGQKMITAYASESRPLKQKTLSDFHWQYDNNASHGSIEWANMNSDQHVEMTKQFLMGKTIFEKTVSATQGNHPTPPKYMYNFKTMKQKNTATDFERDIRIVDNSALPLPPVVHTAKPMVARRVISNVTRRSEFHRHSDNWPTQLGYHGLGGHWLGEDCYNNNPVLHGLPPADYSSSDDLLKYFKWRPLPKLSVNKALVDYYSFDSAKLRFAHFMNIVKNQEKSFQKELKCSVLFHSGTMEGVAGISATGFQNLSAANGAMCGTGSYMSVYPYADYCMGKAISNLTYMKYDCNNFGAMLVCVGAVVPSEYTYDATGDIIKAGSGIRGTATSKGICGGTFLEDKIDDENGEFPVANREVVFWFDKQQFICPLGIIIFTK